MGEQGSPGPWTVNDDGDVLDSEGRLVAHLQDRACKDGKYLCYYIDASDAAIIAAAPQLLDHLQRWHVAAHPRGDDSCETCQFLKAIGQPITTPGDGRR